MIVIPIFAEQDFNGERVERNGYGIRLELRDLTELQLTTAITSIVENKRLVFLSIY